MTDIMLSIGVTMALSRRNTTSTRNRYTSKRGVMARNIVMLLNLDYSLYADSFLILAS